MSRWENLGPVGLLKQEISIETSFGFPSLPALCLCVPVHALPASLLCPGAKEPSLLQSQECWELTFLRGQWEESLGSQAGPALPSSVIVTAMCWLCQKRNETGLGEKLPVVFWSGAEGGQLCLPAGSQHGSASCSHVEPAFIFFNNPQRGFIAVLLFVIQIAVLLQ